MSQVINMKVFTEIEERFADLAESFADEIASGTFIRQMSSIVVKEGNILCKMVRLCLRELPQVQKSPTVNATRMRTAEQEEARAERRRAERRRQRAEEDEIEAAGGRDEAEPAPLVDEEAEA